MEKKIYEILKKHKLLLKKREELMVDLLALLDDSIVSHPCEHNNTEFRNIRCDCCENCGEIVEIDV